MTKLNLITPALLLLAVVTSPLVRAQAQADEEFLPTPYSAEQIRDGWPLGSQAVTRVVTPDRTTDSRSWVSEWSQEGATFCDALLDEEGRASAEPSCSPVTWVELRDHAKFPAATTARERAHRTTQFGDLAGWLYSMDHADGSRSEFFFADDYPGPPLIYGKASAGTILMSAEITSRGTTSG